MDKVYLLTICMRTLAACVFGMVCGCMTVSDAIHDAFRDREQVGGMGLAYARA